MNRKIADAFAVLNLILFGLAVLVSVFSLLAMMRTFSTAPNFGTALLMMGTPLIGLLFGVITCGLVCILVEIMRSLRKMEPIQAVSVGPLTAKSVADDPATRRSGRIDRDRDGIEPTV